MRIRVLELFGGIGACTAALKKLGFDVEIVDYVEIDKYACASYNAINGTDFKPQDICQWDKEVECDLCLHGSPCTDISLAGLQMGADEGSGTRSSLMYESLRIIKKIKPKYVIWENVANLISERHFHNFANYLNVMADIGYANAYKVLNTKDYGIPQNRDRVFTVSVLGGQTADLFGTDLLFDFPKPFPLKLRLKDMLEDNVSEKYYLSEKGVQFVLADMRLKKQYTAINGDIAIPLTAKGQMNWTGTMIDPLALDEQNGYIRNDGTVGAIQTDGSSPKHNNRVIQIGNAFPTKKRDNPDQGRIYSTEGLSPTLNTMGGGNRQPFVLAEGGGIDVIGNYSPSGHNASRIVSTEGIAPTVKENHGTVTAIPIKNATEQGYLLAEEGDGIDISSRMEHHRGTVQKQMAQALTTAGGGRKRCGGER